MPTETELEHRLRSDLRSRQAEAPLLPADLVDVVRRRHRRGRRAQLLTAAAVAVVALFTGAATLIGDRTPGRSSDTAGTPSARPVPGILDWPTRGSLAGDTDWVEGVRRLDWDVPSELQGDVPEPPVDARHVAFAGDVPDGRVALVVGVDDGLTAAAWFTGPADAEPADMEAVDLPQRAHPTTSAQAMVRSASPTGADVLLVAVGPPGSSMDLSAPPAVDAAGGESHPRVELPTDDGVAVYTLHGSWSFTREIRIRVDDRLSYQVLPTLVFTDDPGPTGPRRGEVEMTEDFIVGETTASLLTEYALTEDQARPSVLVSGDGHGDADGTERAVLIGLTFPSGATGVWLLTYEKQPDGWSSTLGRLPHAPAGTRVEERLVAVPVDGAHLALHAPAAAVRAEVLTAEGAVLGSVDLVDGGYVGEVPGGSFAPSTDGAATVRAVDAAGRTVSEGSIGRVVTE